jgi:hypothetical protein
MKQQQEYLIFENRPCFPSKEKQVFGAYATKGKRWEEVREWLSADVANYRRVMADNQADAIKQAEALWKGKLTCPRSSGIPNVAAEERWVLTREMEHYLDARRSQDLIEVAHAFAQTFKLSSSQAGELIIFWQNKPKPGTVGERKEKAILDVVAPTGKEFIVWGIAPGKTTEEPLYTKAKSQPEAQAMLDRLTREGLARKCRIQVLDMSTPPDFVGAIRPSGTFLGSTREEARALVMKNKKLLHDHAAGFQGFFKVPLGPYMNDVTGFDIIKFDEMIKTPDGVSTHDFVMRKYGLQALNMIKALIGMK